MKCPLLIDDSAVSQGAALLRSGRRMLHACGAIDTPELLRAHDERRVPRSWQSPAAAVLLACLVLVTSLGPLVDADTW